MEENDAIIDLSRKKLLKVPDSAFNHNKDLIEELYLDSNNIELLPKGLFYLANLRIFSSSDNNLCKLPSSIENLVCLQRLDVSKNCISTIPDNISKCTELCQVDASVNPLVKLPDELVNLPNLTHLILNETFLDSLPQDFGRLAKLEVLELRHNHLQTLPKSMHNLKEVERLDIGDNKFVNLPVAVGYLASLQELLADCNLIEEIPPVIGLLRNLTFLELSKNKLECLPPEIEALTSLTDLHLSVNELLEIPENIGSLRNLQTLKLDENDLIFLPSSIGRLENLEELDVTANNLESIPASLGQLKKLRVLTLDNNCIKSIPDELGNCSSLSLLSLHSNEIISIPESMGDLEKLQVIKLSANMLRTLPISLSKLQNLRALWLSENQSKPILPLEKRFDKKTKTIVATCSLLPQELCNVDEDEEEFDGSRFSPIGDEKETVFDDREVVRTRGSISKFLSSENHQNKHDAEHLDQKPCYKQELIENTDEDRRLFLNDYSEGFEATTIRSSSNKRPEMVLRRYCDPNAGSYLNGLENAMTSSLKISCDQPTTSLQNTGCEQDTYSFLNEAPPWTWMNSSSLSTQTGVLNSPGLANHIGAPRLALTTSAESNNVYGNTSARQTSQPVFERDINNSRADHSYALTALDDENMMRLKFSNKRNRNGNPLCQYEAFKPTRFNLYQDSNDVSWNEALNKDTVDTSSPMIKKKSITVQDNPIIGERLARDESPQRVGQQYRVIQKYEEKIRALQQQRLRERSRRKSNTARMEYQLDNASASLSPPPMDTNPTAATSPKHVPRFYIISDDDDSVAIKLGDFALASPLPKPEPSDDNPSSHPPPGHNESMPPVDGAKQHESLTQRQTTVSHYDNHDKKTLFEKRGDIQVSLQPHDSENTRSVVKERYRADDNDKHHSDSREDATLHNYTQFEQQITRIDRDGENHLINLKDNYYYHNQKGLKSKLLNEDTNYEHGTSANKLFPGDALQHVTIKSRETERPLSPRLIMTSDEKSGGQEFTYKEFKPDCTVNDVTSFLLSNINETMSGEGTGRDRRSPIRKIDQEQIPVDCDVEDVTRNISKHLVDSCNVEETRRSHHAKGKRVRVTDLDMPDAACLLSKNAQYRKLDGNAAVSPLENYQIIEIPDGQKEEIQLRVFRSPNLGFSIGGGVDNETTDSEGIYVVAVKSDGPSYHLLKVGDRILEVNKLNLRDVSHEHAVLFLTHNQQLDLLIERSLEE